MDKIINKNMKTYIYFSKKKLKVSSMFTESGAINISAFPKPKMTELGHTYEIPTAHCNMKDCELKTANKVKELGILPSKGMWLACQ